MVYRNNSDLNGGSSGARSRDLRIKRPRFGLTYVREILGGIRCHKTCREAPVLHPLFSSGLDDPDPLSALRRWTTGGAS